MPVGAAPGVAGVIVAVSVTGVPMTAAGADDDSVVLVVTSGFTTCVMGGDVLVE